MHPALLAAFPFIADGISNAVSGKSISQHIGNALNGGSGATPEAAPVAEGSLVKPPVQEEMLQAPEQQVQQMPYDASMSPEMKRQAAIQAMQSKGVPMTTQNLDMMLRSMDAMVSNPAATESSILANVPGLDPTSAAIMEEELSGKRDPAAPTTARNPAPNLASVKGPPTKVPPTNAKATTEQTVAAAIPPTEMAPVQDFGTEPKAPKTKPGKNPLAPNYGEEDYSYLATDNQKNARGAPKVVDLGPVKSDTSHLKDAPDPLKMAVEAGLLGRKGEEGGEIKGSLKVRNLIASLKEMKPQERASYLAKLQQTDPKTHAKVRAGLDG